MRHVQGNPLLLPRSLVETRRTLHPGGYGFGGGVAEGTDGQHGRSYPTVSLSYETDTVTPSGTLPPAHRAAIQTGSGFGQSQGRTELVVNTGRN
jgi:hypothetical protein